MEIGSPGWIHTSTVPLNRRAVYCYPTEQLKMVSAAGLAPAIPRSQAECVGCYATRCSPRRFVKKPPGSCFLWRRRTRSLMQVPGQDWRTRRELHPQPSRRQRGALLIELRVRNGGKCCSSSSLPALFSDTRFTVGQPDHFPGIWVREWESHPPEEVYEASLCSLVEFPAIKWWSRWVTLPHQPACRAGALLVCHDPNRKWQ